MIREVGRVLTIAAIAVSTLGIVYINTPRVTDGTPTPTPHITVTNTEPAADNDVPQPTTTTTTTVAPLPPPPVKAQPKTTPAKPATTPTVTTWETAYHRAVSRVGGQFVIRDRGSWGATSMSSCIAYIAPRTPLQYVDDVVYHEGGHIRQCQRGMAPDEHVADCFAKLMGATWFNYGCTKSAMVIAKELL